MNAEQGNEGDAGGGRRRIKKAATPAAMPARQTSILDQLAPVPETEEEASTSAGSSSTSAPVAPPAQPAKTTEPVSTPAATAASTTIGASPGVTRGEALIPTPGKASADLRPGWGDVVTTVLDVPDPKGEYSRLVAALSLGEESTQYGSVRAALDAADANYFAAVRLHRVAKLEDERVGAMIDEKLEVIRTAAREEIEADGAKKLALDPKAKIKAPTIQDIRDRMLAGWGDQVIAHEQRKASIHGTAQALEELAGAWRSRASSLRSIMDRVAPLGSR